MSNRVVIVGNILLSLGICAFLLWLIYLFRLDSYTGTGLRWLPAFNAVCNGISASFVLAGICFIKTGHKRLHVGSMIAATTASALFLVGYLTHHTLHGDTKFLAEGWIRPVYFFILISHVLLSVVALPLVLNTLTFAALKRWNVHRMIARWTYPIWLYVSVTGVLIFVFLRILNPAIG